MTRFKTHFNKSDSEPHYELPEPGVHIVKVSEISEQTSKKSGDPMILFIFETQGGSKLWHYCMNTPSNRWMLKKTLEAITGNIQPEGEIEIDTDDLIGCKLSVKIEHEIYQGKKKAKIADVISNTEVSKPGQDVDLPF